ncbi:phage tail protein [Flavihumibacter solisilvae]|uniref:Glycerol acyltransferase n=1 Tax=Flavihumibacter solisilvae TaxID=1349421 RepID=A0A0C1IY18_9BACT|nr:phage tail protein [Flavihumibacter solisilvae]KIC95399.1 glycerol acyltransferase [Flavihumibacter solisilvae]
MPHYYPPTGFHFKVEFMGVAGMNSDTEQRFQEVTGLSFEIETEEVREGGENRFSYKFPKRIKYPNLVLKRGLLKGTAIRDWFKSAINTYFTVAVYDFKPADIMVTLLDDAGLPVAQWNVVQAYPLKWSVSDLKASDNSIVVESIELAYQYFERKI